MRASLSPERIEEHPIVITAVTRLLFALLLLALLPAAQALPVPAPPAIAAKGYILEDYFSGQVLAESNAGERMEPASITKLMTAYVVFSALKHNEIHLTDMVTVSERAWRTEGSRMFAKVGTQVAVEDLLKGMIIQSGNDSSVALAEHVAGGEEAFAGLMNRYAERLGLKDTHFMNATGLPDPQHYTTARDIARLTRAIITDFPDFFPLYSQKSFTYNNITQYNRNKLLWRDPSVDGMKTGHTESAGFCLVTTSKRADMRLISVVLGTASENARAKESETLLDYGFRFFETHKLYPANGPLAEARVWKGEHTKLALGPAGDIYATIPRGQYGKLNATMQVDANITAPVTKGGRYGAIRITLGDDLIQEEPLVAYDEIPEGGLWRRMVDSVILWFE